MEKERWLNGVCTFVLRCGCGFFFRVREGGGGLPQHLTRFLPFVPTSLVQETTSFLHDSNKLRSLLFLIFSPNKDIPLKSSSSEKEASSSSSTSLEKRLEYQTKLEEYLTIKEVYLSRPLSASACLSTLLLLLRPVCAARARVSLSLSTCGYVPTHARLQCTLT